MTFQTMVAQLAHGFLTTLAIFVLVLVFNHLADYLRDRLDPALRSER